MQKIKLVLSNYCSLVVFEAAAKSIGVPKLFMVAPNVIDWEQKSLNEVIAPTNEISNVNN